MQYNLIFHELIILLSINFLQKEKAIVAYVVKIESLGQ